MQRSYLDSSSPPQQPSPWRPPRGALMMPEPEPEPEPELAEPLAAPRSVAKGRGARRPSGGGGRPASASDASDGEWSDGEWSGVR